MLRSLKTSFCFLFLFSSFCGAQEFFGAGVSAQTAARGGIYVPSGDNALDALSINPAGLSALTAPVMNLSAMGLMARGSFQNSVNADSRMRGNIGLVPYGAVGIPLGQRWTVAAAFTPDLLSASKWRFLDAPGVAGATYGTQPEESKIVAYRGTAGMAYRVSSRISAGAAVSVVYNANTLIMPYVFQSHPALSGLKTSLDLHTSGLGWNAAFGTVVRPANRWAIGAAFRTRSKVTSTGTATGNMGAQFAALGIPFRPDFRYRAQVRVELPQEALVSVAWQKSTVLRFSTQVTWTGWRDSFHDLPVLLTNGTNSDINGFLGGSSIADTIPLHWKNQFSIGGAVERKIAENFGISGGFAHRNSPVPSSTLSPLTAAIMSNSISGGGTYNKGRMRFDLAYRLSPTRQQSAGRSALLSGEFDNSRVKVGTQAVLFGVAYRL